ncbi:MAG: SURF1 family protein [Alphaproteobacteria bacterium]|nr:SURF1 family protein [Alphaproteobacteria bacterium]
MATHTRRFRPGLWPTLTLVLGLPLLLVLGTWQVQRLEWKTSLIAMLEARHAQPAVALPAVTELGPDLAHRPVRVTAELAPDPVLRYGVERQQGRPGHDVLQLARLADGRALVVNRGWLAEDAPPVRTPAGEVTLEGPVRWIADLERRWPTPANDPQANRWYWYDQDALARAFGAEVLPVVLVASERVLAPGPAVPVPQSMAVNLPNNHLGYAITWYGLAVALIVIYALYGLKRGKDTR